MGKDPTHDPPAPQPGDDPSSGFDLSKKTETPDREPTGNLSMPGYDMEVVVKSPPSIVWYWVLKEKLDRLKDAIGTERLDRRSEFIVGGAGLAIGTARDTLQAFKALEAGKNFSGWDLAITALFIVSAGVALWFWLLVKSKASNVDTILSEIEENRGEANVTSSPPKA